MAEWHLSGDYFENCNCSVMCPCFVSKAPPLTSRPTEGVCDVALIFHIEKGAYDDVVLDGLNAALVIHTPGPMAEGNWSLGAYIDQRANDEQADALGAIFTGAAVGPIAQWRRSSAKTLGLESCQSLIESTARGVLRKYPISCTWLLTRYRPPIRVERCGRISAIPSVPTKLRLLSARQETPLTITGCIGIIQARMGFTRRSVGLIVLDVAYSATRFGRTQIRQVADVRLSPSNVRFWGKSGHGGQSQTMSEAV